MTTALEPATTDTGHDDRTTHVVCCVLDTALCGHDVTNDPFVTYGVGHDCVVCLDLEAQTCPNCGAEYDPNHQVSQP